jgi:hypothetical protein
VNAGGVPVVLPTSGDPDWLEYEGDVWPSFHWVGSGDYTVSDLKLWLWVI